MKQMKWIVSLCLLFSIGNPLYAQSLQVLSIPPVMSGTDFVLNVQDGTQSFLPGWTTPTYGINGPFMAPTIIVNKGDVVSMHVNNGLSQATTMHWHGLHVAAMADGGPHQSIAAGSSWDPSFEIMNDAATYWYHPHGDGRTDPHVSKGLAGMLIVKDDAEALLDLPRSYGVDDFPIIVQSKAFDVLHQIAIATGEDTMLMVNGTPHPYLDAPAQVIRLRLLNGSSMRSYLFGFSGDLPFYSIATDDGMREQPLMLTRYRLSPGERTEILIDLSAHEGDTIQLRSFSSELPAGIYGSDSVGYGMAMVHDYDLNPLNGADFDILQMNIVPATAAAVTSIPSSLIPMDSFMGADTHAYRSFVFEPEDMMDTASFAEGPFTINGKTFDMDSINETVILNSMEVWTVTNNTLIAHPFHIHDIYFHILSVEGNTPPAYVQGKKDVVLVMPGHTVRLLMKFEDFADPMTPYMYHCHLLHHEDDGMMGSFLVIDTSSSSWLTSEPDGTLRIFPNPVKDVLQIQTEQEPLSYTIYDLSGNRIQSGLLSEAQISLLNIPASFYLLELQFRNDRRHITFIKQ